MKRLPNATRVGFSSRYNLKHLITKPLHYLIQMFTGSKLHHEGIMCDGMLYEAGNKGVRKIPFEQKLKEIDDCIDVIIFKPTKLLTLNQLIAFRIDLESQLGKQYSATEAFFSILTGILFLTKSEPKNKKQFCSKLVFRAYQKIHSVLKGILPRTQNPEENTKVLRFHNLIQEGEILKR